MKEDDIMNYLTEPEYAINYIEWDPALTFSLQEAYQLLNHEVIRAVDRHELPKPSIEKTGIIVGILTMNDEIEILIKFMDGMVQLIKTELCGDFIMVPDDI